MIRRPPRSTPLSLHDALPIYARLVWDRLPMTAVFMPLVAAIIAERVNVKLGLWLLPVLIAVGVGSVMQRSEEHTSELQSRLHLVCRLLLEKKNNAHDYHVVIY